MIVSANGSTYNFLKEYHAPAVVCNVAEQYFEYAESKTTGLRAVTKAFSPSFIAPAGSKILCFTAVVQDTEESPEEPVALARC